MTDFILGVFEITIGMSLFIALLLLGLKLFGGKFTAKCRYIIWALVMIRLAIPFSFGLLPTLIEIPIDTELVQSQDLSSVLSENTDTVTSVQPSDPGDVVVTPTTPSTPVFPNVDTANPGSTPILPVTPTVPGDQAESVIPSDPVIETPTEQPVSLRQILDIAGIVYLTGAAIFLVWSLVSYFIYTRKILRSAKAADERTQQIFSTICKKYGIKKQPTLLVASGIHSPAAFGIFQRKIVLPDITFNENGLVGTLAHEVTHCKRGDLYMKLVELIACSLNWFNPLVHIAAFQCEMEMELSCDEKVLSGSSEAARAAYADVMLDIIRRCRRNRGALTTHFNPKKSAVTARFKNILYGSGKRRGRILIGVCLVLCILAGAFVACQIGDDLTDDAAKDSKVGLVTENLADFLTEEQIALYEKAGVIYPLFNGMSDNIHILHLLLEGASFEEQANYRVAHQNKDDGIHKIDRTTYRPSYGEYDTFNEFKELCVSVFAEECFEELNAADPYSSFIDHNGKLYNIDAARGGRFGYAPDEFPDEYELVEMTDEVIVFNVTGHYKSSNVNPNFTLTEETFTVKMILTENGWRFAKFADAGLDELPLPENTRSDISVKELDFNPLMEEHSERISLYCSTEDFPHSAKHFRINFGGHEAYISPKVGSALISITWPPELYCMDIAVPTLPADGIDDAVIILTTGTGTGVHTEEAYVLSGADGKLYSFIEPYILIDNLVEREKNGAAWIIDPSGNRIDLPDNVYFDQNYKFYIEDGCLNAKVLIGYDVWQYTEDDFVIRYGASGSTWEYVYANPNNGKSIDSSLTDLLTMPASELKKTYGPMTLAWSESGPGQPVYRLGGKYGVYTVYYATDMNETIPDNRCPDEIIVMKPYSDGDVCGLFIGDYIHESTAGIYWTDASYSVINGHILLSTNIGDYILELILGITPEQGAQLPNEAATTAEDWAAWESAFIKSPFGKISSMRIRKAIRNPASDFANPLEKEDIEWTQYTEIDEQTGYELSFSIPESWNHNTDGVLYDENGNKRIDAFAYSIGYPFESFKDDLREIANGKLHNLDYAITGGNNANISYIGYHISVNPIGEEGPSNYYFYLNYDSDARFYINIYGENTDDYHTFYDEYVLPIIQSVTIRVTGDHVETITSLEDYKLLGPDFYESYYEYTRALIDGDTAKMEDLSMYPEGTLDSYKDVRFTFKSVTREAETGRFILTAEVSEGHVVIPGGTQQFYYCEYPRCALVPILEPPAPNATEASAELSKLLNMTMKFNLDEMEVTEYVIDCLYRKTGKTNFTENEIVEYAKKCFGVDSFTPNEHFKRDGVYTSLAHGGNHIYHDVISTNYGDESGIYSVTVRFYADYAKTVYSHLIKYTMVKLDGDFSFLAQYIEEESPLKPFTHAT